jgi:short-chain Z-isoprenyl diphosphate synthase
VIHVKSISVAPRSLTNILDWCAELQIPAITLWVFSTGNLKRSYAEISGILSAIESKVAALAHDSFLHQQRIRIQAIGRLDPLPESVIAAIHAELSVEWPPHREL